MGVKLKISQNKLLMDVGIQSKSLEEQNLLMKDEEVLHWTLRIFGSSVDIYFIRESKGYFALFLLIFTYLEPTLA
jgi:hypothetical protein